MRKELRKALIEEFENLLGVELLRFEKAKLPVPIGCRGYVWKKTPQSFCCIILFISPKDDSFTIEIAKVHDGQFPAYSFFGSIENKESNFRGRLGFVSDKRRDFWWYLSEKKTLEDDLFKPETPLEECFKKIRPAVAEAINDLKTFALPFFIT
jgi:hypothetical protein